MKVIESYDGKRDDTKEPSKIGFGDFWLSFN